MLNGHVVHLSALEYKLLDCLIQNARRVLTHQTLLSHIWGWEYSEETDYLKVYVRRPEGRARAGPGRTSLHRDGARTRLAFLPVLKVTALFTSTLTHL
jgi:DNA-binding response OmpR family regulator